MRRGGYLSLGLKDVFDPKGRIDRITYFIYGMMLTIMVYVAAAIGGLALGILLASVGDVRTDASSPAYAVWLVAAFYLVILGPFYYGHFCIRAKRLHDIGLPAILGLIGLIDVIGMAVFSTHDIMPFLPGDIVETKAGTTDILFWVSIGFNLLLLFVPGQRGPNRYGENSVGKPLSKPTVLEG